MRKTTAVLFAAAALAAGVLIGMRAAAIRFYGHRWEDEMQEDDCGCGEVQDAEEESMYGPEDEIPF